jgi:aryl-alcohol dehydrogenase-like predicted oxidoreductase
LESEIGRIELTDVWAEEPLQLRDTIELMNRTVPSKLLLGGASFGNQYGVSNQSQISESEVHPILSQAFSSGFIGIDTAPNYGNSEKTLGMFNLTSKEVFTKISSEALGSGVSVGIESVRGSLHRLNTTSLTGLTFHSSDAFLSNPKTSKQLVKELLELELISNWGVSVYEPNEVYKVLEVASPNYIQAPVNILDRRFLQVNIRELLMATGTSLQARSIFLQGLLLMPADQQPPYFTEWYTLLERVRKVAAEQEVSMLSLALNFVNENPAVDKLVLGVNSLNHVREIADSLSTLSIDQSYDQISAVSDLRLIDPRKWTIS